MGREGQAITGHAIGQLRDIAAERDFDRLDVQRRAKGGRSAPRGGAGSCNSSCHPVFQTEGAGHKRRGRVRSNWGMLLSRHRECSSSLFGGAAQDGCGPSFRKIHCRLRGQLYQLPRTHAFGWRGRSQTDPACMPSDIRRMGGFDFTPNTAHWYRC